MWVGSMWLRMSTSSGVLGGVLEWPLLKSVGWSGGVGGALSHTLTMYGWVVCRWHIELPVLSFGPWLMYVIWWSMHIGLFAWRLGV